MEKKLIKPLVVVFGLVAILFGSIALLGWVIESHLLIHIIPIFPPVRTSAAIAFIFLGMNLILHLKENRWFVLGTSTFVLFGSLWICGEHFLNVEAGIDVVIHTLLFSTSSVSRLPLIVCVCIAILALANILLVLQKNQRSAKSVCLASIVVFAISAISLFIYLFGVALNYSFILQNQMSAQSTIALMSLSLGLFFLTAVRREEANYFFNDWHPIVFGLQNLSVRKKFLGLIIVVFTGLSLCGVATAFRFVNNRNMLKIYSEKVEKKQRYLLRMQELFGYGGGTFYFKNLILRGSREYEPLAKDAFRELLKYVDKYIMIDDLTAKEFGSLEVIREVATDYLYYVDQVLDYLAAKKSPKEIDTLMWIDDDKALTAFNNLFKEYEIQSQMIINNVNESRNLLVFVVALGFLFTIAILLIFGHLVNTTVLAALFRATHMSREIANGKYVEESAIKTKDELGVLLESLFAMQANIKSSQGKLIEKTREVVQTNSFLNSIFENIPSMIYVKDTNELKYAHFNRAGEELLGLKKDVVIGKSDFDFLPKPHAESSVMSDRMALKLKHLVEIPEELVEAKSGQRVLNTKKIPILDEGGQVSYLLGISEDVTERRKLENALKENQERLSLALKASHIGIWDWKVKGDVFVADDNTFSIMGMDRRQFKNTFGAFCEIIHPDQQSFFKMKTLDVLKTEKDYEQEFKIVRPLDKKERFVSIKGRVYKDGAGKPERMAGVIMDVSDRVRAEEESKLSGERFNKFFNLPLIGVYIMDHRGQINEANDYFLRMIGYGRNDLPIKSELITPNEWLDQDAQKMKSLMDGGIVDPFEKEFVKRDGSKVPATLSAVRLDLRGNNILVYLRNIAKERELVKIATHAKDANEFSNKELEYVMRTVADHVKEPLREIFMQGEELKNLAAGHVAKTADQLTERLIKVDMTIDTLLSYLHIRSSKEKFQEVITTELVQGVVDDLSPIIEPLKVKVEIKHIPNLMACSGFLRILFHNLISSSVRKANGKPLEIAIKGEKLEKEVLITVSDNGDGFTEQAAAKLFALPEFTESSDATLGLNYVVCKKIVDHHSGKITVKSQPNQGATFTFTIPIYS